LLQMACCNEPCSKSVGEQIVRGPHGGVVH
jgi:hypothetical protein